MATIYANGQVPASARTKIDAAGRTLLTPTAKAWAWTVAEVKRRYGWTPKPSDGLSAYRTVAEQERLFRQNYTTSWADSAKFDRRVWPGHGTYWRRPGKAAAAVPGTSNHGKARALDVQGLGAIGSTRHRQFMDVATEVGFSNVEGASVGEPWHQVHDGHTIPKPKPAPKPTPAPTTKELDMFTIRRGLKLAPKVADRRYALVTGDRAVGISVAAYARFKAAGHGAITLPEADYDKIVKALVSEK